MERACTSPADYATIYTSSYLWNRVLSPPEHLEQRLVDASVAGDDLAAAVRRRAAVQVADAASGFLDQQQAGGDVPGV